MPLSWTRSGLDWIGGFELDLHLQLSGLEQQRECELQSSLPCSLQVSLLLSRDARPKFEYDLHSDVLEICSCSLLLGQPVEREFEGALWRYHNPILHVVRVQW